MTAVAEHIDEHHDAGAHGHPSDLTYVKVGGILALLTGMEVSTYWWPHDWHKVTAVLLIIMMVIKFSMVAGYFMHLKFDSKVLSGLFMAGLVLAVGVYIAALSALIYWDHSGTAEFNDPPKTRVIPPPPTEPPVKTAPAGH